MSMKPNTTHYITIGIVCFLLGYGLIDSFLLEKKVDSELERINGVQEALIKEIAKQQAITPQKVDEIVTILERHQKLIEGLMLSEGYLYKGYEELQFQGKLPEGLYIEYGLWDVIGEPTGKTIKN